MHKLYRFGCVLFVILAAFFVIDDAHAGSQNIVISQIQLGDEASARNEFIELYNNSENDVEISNWCLYYQSSSLKTEKLACFTPDNTQTHLFLPKSGNVLAVSNELASSSPINADVLFSSTLSGAAGYVTVINEAGKEVDKVGWGISTPDLDLVKPAVAGNVLARKQIEGTLLLQDTDINSDDFEAILPKDNYSYGQIYEINDVCPNIIGLQAETPDDYNINESGNCVLLPVDICPNIDGLQEVLPVNSQLDENGNCVTDFCANLDGVQLILPGNMVVDEAKNCVELDLCPNLPEVQAVLPPGYYLSDSGDCYLDVLPLQFSEVLPNITGVDEGKEFIEIYNPNGSEVDLSNYLLSVGLDDSEKYFEFLSGLVIKAHQYLAFYNSEIKFTLKNTTDIVRLYSIDKVLMDKITAYESPKADESWAKINDLWQYTNRVSPSAENLAYFEDTKEEINMPVAESCGVNQFRNPETGRCKNIPKVESILAPCKDGQYRSEETNRCRNIASDVIEYMSCAEGEERNPETNRCRKVAAAAVLGTSDLAPCPEGQERNPETNRCKKVVSSIPTAEYKITPVAQSDNSSVIWWSIGGVGCVAAIYGIWEWRKELIKIVKKIGRFLHLVK